MASTIPNKEIVRRICRLYGATKCYLRNPNNNVAIQILTNISNEKLSSCAKELESWAGMKFQVSNFDINNKEIEYIIRNSEEILPIKI